MPSDSRHISGLNNRDYMQITTTTLVQRWISKRMAMRALQIPMLVYLLTDPGLKACSNRLPRHILFKGQTRGSH